MKYQSHFLICLSILMFCSNGFSATMAGMGVRDAASYGVIEKLSVGTSMEWMKRDIKITGTGEKMELDVRTIEFFIGRDISDWLTIFGTLGGTELRISEKAKYGDMNIKGAVGFQGNMLRTEIMDPEFMIGSLTFKSVGQVSVYQIDESEDDVSGYWLDLSLALPVCYELFADKPDNIQKVPYSLAISAGPSLSVISGSAKDSYSPEDKFRERRLFGLFGAVDIYLSHNLSVGCQVEYIDHATVRGSVIYHF